MEIKYILKDKKGNCYEEVKIREINNMIYDNCEDWLKWEITN